MSEELWRGDKKKGSVQAMFHLTHHSMRHDLERGREEGGKGGGGGGGANPAQQVGVGGGVKIRN